MANDVNLFRYIPNVSTLRFDAQKCVGCGMCQNVCPHAVFQMRDKKATVHDKDACMECGACVKNCPVSAIAVDVGVGCAYAVIMGWVLGTEPTCDCKGCC